MKKKETFFLNFFIFKNLIIDFYFGMKFENNLDWMTEEEAARMAGKCEDLTEDL
jgi:hypothetical protein